MKDMIKKGYFWRRIAIVLLLICILIRPTFSTETSLRRDLNLNIWFVVDATNSMVVKDVDNGSTRRFEKVESDIETIVRNVPGAKYSMIVQDYYAYSASPLSSDSEAIISAVGYAKPKYYLYAQPTNLPELLSYANKTISKYQIRYPDRINVLVFFSDGEDVSNVELEIPSEYSNTLKRAFILGYGSKEGGFVEQIGKVGVDFRSEEYDPTAVDEGNYIKYYYDTGKVTVDSEYRIISKLDEDNLTTIANAMNATYYHRESGDLPNEITKTMKDISRVLETESPSEINSRLETYWVFAIGLLGLILWEGAEILNRLLSEKEVKNA